MNSEVLEYNINNKTNKTNKTNKDKLNQSRFNDLTDMFLSINNKFSWKIFLFLFIIVLIVSSDLFVENILSKINKSFVNNNEVNNSGVIMQALIISGSYVFLSIFDEFI